MKNFKYIIFTVLGLILIWNIGQIVVDIKREIDEAPYDYLRYEHHYRYS